jgi:hypothetical protein
LVLSAPDVEHVVLFSERDDAREQHDELEKERRDIEKRITRLVAAVERGGHITSLSARLVTITTLILND